MTPQELLQLFPLCLKSDLDISIIVEIVFVHFEFIISYYLFPVSMSSKANCPGVWGNLHAFMSRMTVPLR